MNAHQRRKARRLGILITRAEWARITRETGRAPYAPLTPAEILADLRHFLELLNS